MYIGYTGEKACIKLLFIFMNNSTSPSLSIIVEKNFYLTKSNELPCQAKNVLSPYFSFTT